MLQKFGVIKLSNLEAIELRKSIESLFDEQVQYIAEYLNPELNNEQEFQEEVKEYFDLVKRDLERRFGVTNMTQIEQVRLRQITEEVLRENNYYFNKRESDPNNKTWAHNMVQPDGEILVRWFWDYGIIFKRDIPFIKGSAHPTQKFIDDFRMLRESSHNP
jgi:hypothetical protein